MLVLNIHVPTESTIGNTKVKHIECWIVPLCFFFSITWALFFSSSSMALPVVGQRNPKRELAATPTQSPTRMSESPASRTTRVEQRNSFPHAVPNSIYKLVSELVLQSTHSRASSRDAQIANDLALENATRCHSKPCLIPPESKPKNL
jgi:hypothetical protein